MREKIEQNHQQIKILLVDDEQTFLKYLAKRLMLEGFKVRTTFSGEEGLDAATEEPFDIAVVDLRMPGINGLQVQKKLKEIQPDIQCIVLTGYGSIESALESGKYGAFKYLSKPVDYETLLQSINTAYQYKLESSKSPSQGENNDLNSCNRVTKAIKKFMRKLHRVYGVQD